MLALPGSMYNLLPAYAMRTGELAQGVRVAPLYVPQRLPPTGRKLQRGNTLLDIEALGSPSQPLDLGWASMDEQSVLAYLAAVGDELPVYRESGLAPPLYAVALALGRILQQCKLPAGAIHSLQEFETLQSLPIGSKLRVLAWLDRQRTRGGLRFLTFGIDMADTQGVPSLSVRTTLLVPDDPQDRKGAQNPAAGQNKAEEAASQPRGDLVQARRKITQRQLSAYSEVSGDYNPLHLDPDFAAQTQFGGIIAHGMLTLALICEMMAAATRESWLSSGTVRVRFKGAAYPGDLVETWGRETKADGDVRGYSIGLSSSATGEDLITGTATVRKY